VGVCALTVFLYFRTLRKSWEQLKQETETIAKLHLERAQKILEEVDRQVKDFRTEQKDARKRVEDTVRKAHQYKKKCYDKNMTLKSSYEGKCRDLDRAKESHQRLKMNAQAKPNDIQKAEKKIVTCNSSMEQADQAYMDAVKALEDARVTWEKEMESMCQECQHLEEQRISFLRHMFWSFSNIVSKSCVDVDHRMEEMRRVLEECDVDSDIDLFVQQRATGTERPVPIPYENYYNPKSEILTSNTSSSEIKSSTSGIHQSRPLPSVPPDDDPSTYSEVNDNMRTTFAATAGGGHTDALYNVPSMRVVAIYDYEAQGDEELTLRDGDIVNVIAKEDDVWWKGELNGKEGMFPKDYVEVLGAKV
jgi:proline-serine-threonine phosphatase interacting protein 1